MRRFIIVLIVCSASCIGTRAQQFSQGYMDSVKGFFRDFEMGKPDRNKTVILNDAGLLSSLLDSNLLAVPYKHEIYLDHFLPEKFSNKIYKFDREIKFNQKKIDSLHLTKKEIRQALSQMIKPVVKEWNTEIIEFGKITTQQHLDSVCTQLKSIADDLFKRTVDTTQSWESRGRAAIKYRTAHDNYFYGTGYWKYCNPVFIKKGRYAVLYYYNFHAPMYVTQMLAVYRNEQGQWQFFGNIFRVDVN